VINGTGGVSVRDDESSVRDSYDRVPYPSASHAETHPDRLAALAILRGLAPAPPERCRVLELGCADGGNLIPMAFELPESTFLGIDLSPRQIESGRAQAAELGLTNLELRAVSILDFEDAGPFDYILCHGVFSWVAPPVQEKILSICRTALAPQGVAFISYNTLPGWQMRRMLRDMLLYHVRGVDDPAERSRRIYELVDFLATSSGDQQDEHSTFLRSARDHFEEYRDRPSYIAHEYLEATNAPLYFEDFIRQTSAHSLQYVGDAEPATTALENMPDAVVARLRGFTSDPVELEQYADFATNRGFRRSLLCHAGLPLSDGHLRRLHFSTTTKPVSARPEVRGNVSESFRTDRGKTFSSTHPLAKAVLVALAGVWPRALSFDGLLAAIGFGDEGSLTDLLASLHTTGVVSVHALPPRCTEIVSKRPLTTSLARRQAEAGLLVTNQHRRVVKLDDPIAHFLVRHLDGTHDHSDLLRLLDREVSAGRLDISVNGQVPDHTRIPAVLQAVLEHHLRRMAEYALLVG
jgi:methyltransferase-like protein/2-polyprenyl-3-methyl-5-hydroxy-6-metoxy-1,4-benzoquinol methylase